MTIRQQFPRAVREIENTFIPLSDGTHLAARIWLPEDAESAPVPAILEYLPYRKRDGTADRDALTHPYFAGHGYAGVRVDIRGNGESDGLMADEYLAQEQADALEVIDWLVAQPWCNGEVGMMGISWGGFNALQVAAHRPPALKAIITICSSDDRFGDDIHYKSGTLLLENLSWAGTMLHFSAAVPDPALVGERWREMWRHRLENMPLLAENWLSRQTRDDYWRHASVNEDYGAIQAAVFCVGGWADPYMNTIPRMMDHLKAPRRALIGPWMHKYPHFAIPEPRIGFLQEAVRWWDTWLKGEATGMEAGPLGHYYIQESVPPAPWHEHRPGWWTETAGGSRDGNAIQHWYLGHDGLSRESRHLENARSICSPLTTGVHQGEFIPLWYGPDFATDQRREDAHALCFDSAPLTEGLNMLGRARLHLRIGADRPQGQIMVRLNDVHPDGRVSRVAYGVLNLALRNDDARVEPMEPGTPYPVTVELDANGYHFLAGHQLRIAITTAAFPLIWPSPELTTLTLEPGEQILELPECVAEAIDWPFEAAESAPPADTTQLRAGGNRRTIEEDVASGRMCVRVENDFGGARFDDHGLWVDQGSIEEYRVHPWDPETAQVDINWRYRAGRGDWSVSVDSWMQVTCDSSHFHIEARQVAHEGADEISDKQWTRRIPRRAV